MTECIDGMLVKSSLYSNLRIAFYSFYLISASYVFAGFRVLHLPVLLPAPGNTGSGRGLLDWIQDLMK